ncbi:MAG: Phosphate transport system permease protein PstA [Firmicutes bacterium]|nr:Phosphate transport system permease protein PstA [candidate division NPL-UPA2 bacterium]
MMHRRKRKALGLLFEALCVLAAGIAILVLALILYYVFRRGIAVVNFSFLTSLPAPVGVAGGGIGNALIGSLLMVGLGALIAVPVCIAAAVFLDQNPASKLSAFVRFATRVLSGVPSMVIGLFVFGQLVLRTGNYSALAGGIALSIVMAPIITLSAEEMLRLVPSNQREASMALGATKQQTVFRLVLPGAAGGLIVGVMLAVALAAGQTAPVLLTALTSRFWLESLQQPTASLPVLIYHYATSPFADWQAHAWGAALVLVVAILVLNVTAQLFLGLSNRRR